MTEKKSAFTMRKLIAYATFSPPCMLFSAVDGT